MKLEFGFSRTTPQKQQCLNIMLPAAEASKGHFRWARCANLNLRLVALHNKCACGRCSNFGWIPLYSLADGCIVRTCDLPTTCHSKRACLSNVCCFILIAIWNKLLLDTQTYTAGKCSPTVRKRYIRSWYCKVIRGWYTEWSTNSNAMNKKKKKNDYNNNLASEKGHWRSPGGIEFEVVGWRAIKLSFWGFESELFNLCWQPRSMYGVFLCHASGSQRFEDTLSLSKPTIDHSKRCAGKIEKNNIQARGICQLSVIGRATCCPYSL